MLSYNQLRVLTGALSISNAVLCITGLRAIKLINQQTNQYKHLADITKYLAHLVKEHDIPLSEFDIIVLSDFGLIKIKEEDSTN